MSTEQAAQNIRYASVGTFALLFGAITALVAALVLISKKQARAASKQDEYDGWGEILGI